MNRVMVILVGLIVISQACANIHLCCCSPSILVAKALSIQDSSHIAKLKLQKYTQTNNNKLFLFNTAHAKKRFYKTRARVKRKVRAKREGSSVDILDELKMVAGQAILAECIILCQRMKFPSAWYPTHRWNTKFVKSNIRFRLPNYVCIMRRPSLYD